MRVNENVAGGIQLDLFYQLADVFDPLREVATRAEPYWTTSERELVGLYDTDPDISIWTKAVKDEYCPYGYAGYFGGDGEPNSLESWEMKPRTIKIEYFDKHGIKKTMIASWPDFAREIADLIWREELSDGEKKKTL